MTETQIGENQVAAAMVETEEAIDWMFKTDHKNGLEELQQRMEDTSKVEESRRDQILNATMESIRERNKVEEANFGKAMLGLRLKMNQMGSQFKEVQEPSVDEVRQLETTEGDVAKLEKKIADLASAVWFKGSRQKKTKEDLEVVKKRVEALKTEIAENINNRIHKAKIGENLQNFLAWTSKVDQIMHKRLVDLEREISSCSGLRDEVFESKAQYAATLEKSESDLAMLRDELSRAEEDLVPLENGKAEYVAQEKKISQLKDQIRACESTRNESLGRFQENEKGIKRLEQHIQAQTGLRDNHKMWLAVLEEVTKVHVVAFQSRLMAIKGAADQEVAKNLDKIGAQVAEEEMAEIASIIKSSDQILMDKIENTPGEIQRMHEILAASTEAKAKIRQRMNSQIREFMNKYGTDPLATSEDTYLVEEAIAG